MSKPRVILHVDMDAFYAAVEVRENPDLVGKPLIIGHRGPRGVVSTCSYEARKFGVRSAMPSVRAEKLCPTAIWLPGRMSLYGDVSKHLRRIFADTTPLFEPISIDEAFLDLTGIAANLDDGRQRAAALKRRITAEHRLTASVGVAPNKFLAKLASDLEKPDGLVIFPLQDIESRLWPLPVERLWGVGPRTAEKLRANRVRCIGDILRTPKPLLRRFVGDHQASHLCRLARGQDDRPLYADHEAKSISEERTYTRDLTSPDDIDRALLQRSEGVARDLRRHDLVGRTVHLKVRTGDFETWTRSLTLKQATDLTEIIVEAARRLFRERIDLAGRGVRLLGVGVSGLESCSNVQASLFANGNEERARRLAKVSDELRKRLGEGAVTRARLLAKKSHADGEEDPPESSSPPSL